MAAGGGDEKERKKGVKSKNPSERGKEVRGERISYHHHGFDDVQRCPGGSVSVQAWRPRRGRSPAARRRARGLRGACAALS